MPSEKENELENRARLYVIKHISKIGKVPNDYYGNSSSKRKSYLIGKNYIEETIKGDFITKEGQKWLFS